MNGVMNAAGLCPNIRGVKVDETLALNDGYSSE